MMTTTAPRRDLAGWPEHPAPEKRSRRRRLRVVLALVLALVLTAAVVWVVEFSAAFATRQVAVVGASRIQVTLIQSSAGVRLGTPLARQDVTAIAARVGAMPQIASATASRAWPDTIRISVVERQPLLGVRQPEGFWMIDRTGTAFEVDGTLPTGVVQAEIDPGNASLLADAAAVIQAMPTGLRHKVDRVATISENSIRVTLTDGVSVNWGSAADSELKGKVVMALLKRNPRSIDVSSPHNPAIR